ncbi:FxSxx-COOH system tetratricopeptide repeat protein [Lentzea sp. NPDC004789]
MTDDRPAPDAPTIAAFTSSTNGIGRTAVVANLAWVLAASGHRVAVADWGTEAPHVHDFLQPFHARTLEVAELLEEVMEVSPYSTPARRLLFDEETFPQLQARRYELPGGLGRVDILSSRDPSTPIRGFSPAPRGQGEVETLREGVRRSSYDYVLIDSPTNLSTEAATRMARLCDVVAVCFQPLRSSISQASAFAKKVWESAPVGVRVLAVPVQFDKRDADRAEQTQIAIRSAFEDLLDHDTDPFGRDLSAELVGIPLYLRESVVETLAVLVDESGAQLDAYHRLASALAGAEIGTVREFPQELRENYRRSIGLNPTHIALDYVPADRPWADWVRSQLTCAGAEVTGPAGSGISLVRICSRNSPADREHFGGRVVVLTVDDSEPPDGEHVPLAGVDEATARTRLLEAFALVAGPATGVRFPLVGNEKRERRQRHLPRRLEGFTGRAAELEAMRDALSDASVLRTWWLTGPAASGKTELVKEYAHRFGFDYEHVWWIPAHDRRTITEHLAGLARVLGIEMESRVTESVLDRLGAAAESRRWLLIYDGADDPEVLRGLVPARGSGHVVVTSRAVPGDSARHTAAEPGPHTAADGVATPPAALGDPTRHTAAEPGPHTAADDVATPPAALGDPTRHTAAEPGPHTAADDVATPPAALGDPTRHTAAEPGPHTAADDVATPRAALGDPTRHTAAEPGPHTAADGVANPRAALGDPTRHTVTEPSPRTGLGNPARHTVTELGPLTPEDSVAYLRTELGDLPQAHLTHVAALCENEPLALRLARAWIRQIAKRRRQDTASREEAAISAADEFGKLFSASQHQSCAGRALGVVAGTLAQQRLGRSVLQLAKVCSFLSGAGVSLSLLHTAPMLAVASAAPDVEQLDDLELDGVVWYGVRYGLFDVPWGKPPTLIIHRLVLKLVADLMDDEERAAVREGVLAGLAALAPSESQIDDGSRTADVRELREHIVSSDAVTSTSPVVRRWLVNQLRYFQQAGDPEAWTFAVELGKRMLANWPAGEQAELSMRLRFHLANLHRALDQPMVALRIDEQLLTDQTALLGRSHPRTLRTARGVAHGHRVLGNFRSAQAAELRTVRQMRAVLGPDHPDTLTATNNLAFSLFLAGETGEALKVQRENFERRLAVLGPHDPNVWWSACSAGRYLRELGHYDQALDELHEAFQRIAAIAPASPRYELRIKWNEAITYRLLGDAAGAKSLTWETLRGYRQVFGEDHADTRACKLSFAADHHAIGDFETAIRLGRECHRAYQQRLGAYHAFTLMSLHDCAIFLHSLGRGQEEALKSAKEARDGLVTRLGDVHPWTLAARLAHAVIDARTEDVDRGASKLREVHEDCVEFLGTAHPITGRAEANLRVPAAEWKCVVLDVPDM